MSAKKSAWSRTSKPPTVAPTKPKQRRQLLRSIFELRPQGPSTSITHECPTPQ